MARPSVDPPISTSVDPWQPKVGDWVRATKVPSLAPFQITSINPDGYCCSPNNAWLPNELEPAEESREHFVARCRAACTCPKRGPSAPTANMAVKVAIVVGHRPGCPVVGMQRG